MGAYPACCSVRSDNDHDRDCIIGVVRRENGQLDAMGDGGGVVWNVFWGCCFAGVDGFACRARV